MTPKSRTFYFNTPTVPNLQTTEEDKGNTRIWHYVATSVEQEPLQPPWTEVLPHVHVSTYKSWDEMGKWYWGLIKDQLVPDDEVRQRAESLTKGRKDDKAKVRAIYDYVSQRTRYVSGVTASITFLVPGARNLCARVPRTSRTRRRSS